MALVFFINEYFALTLFFLSFHFPKFVFTLYGQIIQYNNYGILTKTKLDEQSEKCLFMPVHSFYILAICLNTDGTSQTQSMVSKLHSLIFFLQF